MNRGYDGNDIFVGNRNKGQFLDYLEGASNQKGKKGSYLGP
jgi:hypothetical protein